MNDKLINPKIIQIQRQACEYFGMNMEEMLGKSRKRGFSRPRQLAMYICYKTLEVSLPEIGAAFGRDHTTAHHAVYQMTALLTTNEALQIAFKALSGGPETPPSNHAHPQN